jgi:hypothetical protein
VVGLCRSADSRWWYFSRGQAAVTTGVFAPAVPQPDGFTAPFPPAGVDKPTFFLRADGVTVGTTLSPAVGFVCLGASDLPAPLAARFAGAPACGITQLAWNPG